MAIKTFHVHEQKPLTSGQQVTLQIPSFGRIQELKLRFTTAAGVDATVAQIRAEVGNIRFTLNGRDTVNCSAGQLLDLYESLGQPNVTYPTGTNGQIELNVGRLFMLSPTARDALGIGTQNVPSIQVTVTAGTLTNVAAVQVFSVRDNVAANLGVHARVINYPQSFNATGDHTVDTLPKEPNTAYIGVLADDGASGAISFGEVRVNSVTVFERMPTLSNASRVGSAGYAQPAGYFNYLFNDGNPDNVLWMNSVQDLRFITTFGTAPGAGGYNLLAITLDGLVQNQK